MFKTKIRFKSYILIGCALCVLSDSKGQTYINSISLKYGLGLPMGNYAGHSRNIEDVIGGMQTGSYWGIEFKSKMLNLKSLPFSEMSYVDYLDKTGFMLIYDQFLSQVSPQSLENIVGDKFRMLENGTWKISNLIFGVTLNEQLNDYLFIMFKLGGGLSEIRNPYFTVINEKELIYKRQQNRFSTFGTMIGIDFSCDFDRLMIQLQSEVFWAKPEIKTTTTNYLVGEIIQFNENKFLVLPKISLSVGYKFTD